MKIAIISDTHDNLPNFKKAIDWIKKQGIKTIIHCGDVACPETLDSALTDFSGQVFVSLGNADVGHGWEKCGNRGVAPIKSGGEVNI